MAIKVIHNFKPKVLVVLGPTASGKTHLGVALAAEFNGEIVSADSRQVYRGLDAGTSKDLSAYHLGRKKIPYHLIDIASPRTKFDLAKYQKAASRAINDIWQRGKLPIIVGGSGLYLQAVIDNYDLTSAGPRSRARTALGKLAAPELLASLTSLKPDFAARLNNSDKNNPRRLARYLEIISSGGNLRPGRQNSPYNFLLFGLTVADADLKQRIEARLLHGLEKEGMVAEVKGLNETGISWERLKSFGLEYKFISRHLLGELVYPEMVEKLSVAIYRFAKKQKTWFKRWERQGREIKWIKDTSEARKEIKKWL